MRQRHHSRRAFATYALAAVVCCACLGQAASTSAADETAVKTEAPAAAATPAPAAAVAQPAATEGAKPDGKKPEGKPGEKGPDGKPVEGKPGEGKPGETKPGETKPPEPPVTQRPMKPTAPANPEELKVRPNADGKLRFSFVGQPWPAVLEWVATVSNMSLDWQELPGDYLNLSTQQAYTVEEVRDLINRHLLARGFTMLRQGEMLAVVSVKKLDPGMVPRVSPAELSKRSPYEFVKVSFTLDWLMAETAAEELKPMLSPNGKLNALKSTNRLEAIDAVTNLREIHALLKEEQSNTGQDRLVREFVLLHARASEVEQQLNTLLGIEDKSKKSRAPTPEELQQQQMQMQMQQEMRQRGGPAPPQEKPKGPPINLVVNSRKNAIVANAPPDKMAIIEQAIKVLDVENAGAQQLLANMNKMQVYRLSAIDPEPLVTTLNDLGVLDPATRLQVDKKNRSIIAYASLADHVTIRALVTKLDGSGRRFEVIQLRRLEADYVAGSINFMMGGAEKEKPQQRRNYYYDFGGYYGGRNQQEEASTEKFRVDADVDHNRLLVWASQVELDEVMNLLAKLGEIPARGSNTNTVRVLHVEPGKDAMEALERIRRAWPRLSPNPLIMPSADEAPAPADKSPLKEPAENSDSPAALKKDRKLPAPKRDAEAEAGRGKNGAQATHVRPAVSRNELAQADDKAEAEEADDAGAAAEDPAPAEAVQDLPPPVINRQRRPGTAARAAPRQPPAITVTEGPNGELVATSSDTEALDMFEEMLLQFAPERRDYQVFYLHHASAFWVSSKLEDYFEVEDKKKTASNNRFNSWFFGGSSESDNKNDNRRLSRRRSLKFITDIDTNTILVQGADPARLKLIEELIKVYDQPEPINTKAARVTKVHTLRYSKAKVVGEAVKDVYRDLLSSIDKALQNGDQQQKNKRPESQNVYITNLGGESEGDEKRTQVSFKGKLSVGIDELSNTIVISTEGENLMQNVTRMIEALDQAAKPALATVGILKMGRRMDSEEVRKAIARVLAEQQQSQAILNGQNGQNGQNQQGRGQQQPMQQNNNANGGGNNGNNGNGQQGQ